MATMIYASAVNTCSHDEPWNDCHKMPFCGIKTYFVGCYSFLLLFCLLLVLAIQTLRVYGNGVKPIWRKMGVGEVLNTRLLFYFMS